MRQKIAIVCHRDTDPQCANDLLMQYVHEVCDGLDLQVALGRAPAAVLTGETDGHSLMLYIGNREFAKFQGMRTDDGSDYYALAMPADCEDAIAIQALQSQCSDTIYVDLP